MSVLGCKGCTKQHEVEVQVVSLSRKKLDCTRKKICESTMVVPSVFVVLLLVEEGAEGCHNHCMALLRQDPRKSYPNRPTFASAKMSLRFRHVLNMQLFS